VGPPDHDRDGVIDVSYDNQTDFNSDHNAEEWTHRAITDLGTGPLGINVPDTGLDPGLLEDPGFDL